MDRQRLDIERMSRDELVAVVRRFTDQNEELSAHLDLTATDLSTHQTELRAQHDELEESHSELQRTRDEYAELFDFAPVAYLSLGPSGLIVAANLTACGLLGLERARCLGLPLATFFSQEDKAGFLEHLRQANRENRIVRTDLVLVSRDGRRVPIELLTKTSATIRGKPRILRTALLDLTDRRQAEGNVRALNAVLEARVRERVAEIEAVNNDLRREVVHRRQAELRARESEAREAGRAAELQRLADALRDADRQKDAFMAMLAHELRNPLGPLRSAVEVWRISGTCPPHLREMQDIIDRQVSQLSRLVDDLLDVSRIATGKIRLERQTFDLATLAREVAEDHQADLDAAGLSFERYLPDRPVWVHADRTRIAQACDNLLNNARKFTDAGGRVDLSLEAGESHAVLSVSDTGIGMEPETIQTIFHAFVQADRSLDRTRGGLGLGLALAKGLVELQGGEVRVESAGLGQGSKFELRLPLASKPDAAEVHEAPPAAVAAKRVLVVDDRRDATLTLSRLLATLGHQVETASSAAEALAKARRWSPTVIISDIGLPGADGYSLARDLRQDPELCGVQLIALTGYGRAEDQAKAREAGFDHHLTKPASLESLRQLLGKQAD